MARPMDLAPPPSFRPTLLGRRHMIVAGHPLAAMAGMRILEGGGNAVDAGVAAGLALNVTKPDMASLGGVAPIMVRMGGAVSTIAGIGRWPRAVTRERLAAAGGGRIPASPARWVVPAAVDAWLLALIRFGSLSLAEVLAPAIELAAEGFPANYWIRHNIGVMRRRLGPETHNAEVFTPGGEVPAPGAVIRQPQLADTLRRLVDAERARGGSRADGLQAARDAFYRGEIAEIIGRFARAVGAFLAVEDLNDFSVKEEPPIAIDYRGHRLFGCGPWSQGPALLQMMALLAGFRPAEMAPDLLQHVLIEASKLALTDRNRFYGDPERVAVPIARLLSADYAAERRCLIDPAQARDPGQPALAGAASPDTTYVAVVDRDGNAFSAVPSDSTILVTPMVPGLGFGISDRGLQASLDPYDPNVVAPGKRPRLTPNPAILVGEDFVLPLGSPGGDVQTQAMGQVLVNHIDLGMELQAAVEAPRWASFAVPVTEDPHPCEPNLVRLEGRAAAAVFEGLAARGHRVERWHDLAPLAGGVCAIRRETDGRLAGAADPRRMGYAIGW